MLKFLANKCYKFYPSEIQGLPFPKNGQGYFLLTNEGYFKQHMNEFVAHKYLE